MTETTTIDPTPDDDEPTDAPLTTQQFVARQVWRIQRQYLPPDQTPWSRAALARLRRSIGRPPGTVPEVLDLIVNPTAPDPGAEGATPDELAIATALGLYAVHQQSLSEPMHVPGVRFGTAVGGIRFRDGIEVPGVTRRFQAFGTADQWDELVHHARSLVHLLRDRRQGLDYGLLASDLVQYQRPVQQDTVRLRWGRAFYRVTATPAVSTAEEH